MNRNNGRATGGRVANSNQKYSIVSRNDAVEVGEMVMMDHDGTGVVDLAEDGEQLDFLEVACLLREKLSDFVEGGKGGPPGLELRSLLNMAASRKIVWLGSKKMSPELWKALPKELLLLVLARLPLSDITRLRSLSKEWNRDMATVNSEINRVLDETNPTLVAGFSWGVGCSNVEYVVAVCDLSNGLQYSYRSNPGNPLIRGWDDMGARDGGLICFVSTWRPSRANPVCIIVANLLTRVQRKLPPLKHVYSTPPKMMHMEVNSETKCYRVVVVGENLKGCPTVEIYNSGARKWTKARPSRGVIFGLCYTWRESVYDGNFTRQIATQSMYDIARGQLQRCDLKGPSQGTSVITYVLEKDCMFVLHRSTSKGEIFAAEGLCITKYRIQNNAKDWVQERSYVCSPLQALLEEDNFGKWTLEACEGFLMVFLFTACSYEQFWLLELSTGEWRRLPNCFHGRYHRVLMTRASWNVVP